MQVDMRIRARRTAVAARVTSYGTWQPAELPKLLLDLDSEDMVALGALVLFGLTLLLYAAVMSGAL